MLSLTTTLKFNKNIESLNYAIPKRKFSGFNEFNMIVYTAAALPTISCLSWLATRYKISKPHQYLVRTGLGIKDIKVTKTGFQWPFQKISYIDMNPRNFTFNLHAMSSEKLPFVLPGVFTIGPNNENQELVKYARTLANAESGADSIHNIILGILEGDTRTLSSQMTMEEIFNDRKAFKDKIIKSVQEELKQFGLLIYNANIKELQDAPESKYFGYLMQKRLSQAENTAKVDVAEAKKNGDIGGKHRETETRQKVAIYESDTVKLENESRQDIAKSQAELKIVENEARRKTMISEIEAINAAKMREAELETLVEQKRVLSETEKLRAIEFSKAHVHAEILSKEAEGKANAIKIEADAHLYSKNKEAEGVMAMYSAQAQGIERLVEAFNNQPDDLMKYIMIKEGVYVNLAKTNASAIQGLNPKITVWSTGDNSKSDNYTKPIADLLKMIPPLFTTINDQSEIQLPKWSVSPQSEIKKETKK